MYTTLALKKGSDFRIRSGHPWVFSNELQHSPKSMAAGLGVRLVDFKGSFLGVGYGHPQSLIAFRKLSNQDVSIDDVQFYFEKFQYALKRRMDANWNKASFRLVFSEGDGLSGLIIDRFLTEQFQQVFVIQPSTVGMASRIDLIFKALEKLVSEHGDGFNDLTWENTSVICSYNSKTLDLEGLEEKPREILKASNHSLENARIFIPTQSQQNVLMHADFLNGQKTGFFLDQSANCILLLDLMSQHLRDHSEKIEILDLCSYVGQWGVRIAEWARKNKKSVSLHMVDISIEALDWAKKSLESYPEVEVKTSTLDVLKDLNKINEEYDVVICDPPAFVKKKKDLLLGVPAYTKLNRDAIKLCRVGGLFMTCSCSGLLSRVAFEEVLVDAGRKAHRTLRRVGQGGLPPDHPVFYGFSEGDYLKGQAFVIEAEI